MFQEKVGAVLLQEKTVVFVAGKKNKVCLSLEKTDCWFCRLKKEKEKKEEEVFVVVAGKIIIIIIIVIIMYSYHALINALSAHMIHINLNMIFYTHVEHSPTKTIYIKYFFIYI